jgi:hypothetical protein
MFLAGSRSLMHIGLDPEMPAYDAASAQQGFHLSRDAE